MNQDEIKWGIQIKTLLSTPHALLKLFTVAVLWLAAGAALGFFYNIGFFVLSIFIFLVVLWIFPFWQPLYWIVYSIVGNKNVSSRLEVFKLNRTYVISLGVRIILMAYLLYISIRLLLQ